jgi:hypothetical protein
MDMDSIAPAQEALGESNSRHVALHNSMKCNCCPSSLGQKVTSQLEKLPLDFIINHSDSLRALRQIITLPGDQSF